MLISLYLIPMPGYKKNNNYVACMHMVYTMLCSCTKFCMQTTNLRCLTCMQAHICESDYWGKMKDGENPGQVVVANRLVLYPYIHWHKHTTYMCACIHSTWPLLHLQNLHILLALYYLSYFSMGVRWWDEQEVHGKSPWQWNRQPHTQFPYGKSSQHRLLDCATTLILALQSSLCWVLSWHRLGILLWTALHC